MAGYSGLDGGLGRAMVAAVTATMGILVREQNCPRYLSLTIALILKIEPLLVSGAECHSYDWDFIASVDVLIREMISD